MANHDRMKRLSILAKVPALAAVDHRIHLDEKGNSELLSHFTRKERRTAKVQAKRIGMAYKVIMDKLSKSGAGFCVDQFVRQLSIEYTNRYASCGLYSQPLSFNYFEPFCNVKFIENSIAPYAEPAVEVDHIYSVMDFFDFTTTPKGSSFDIVQLMHLPEGTSFHFTPAGNIFDFTFMTPDKREFVVAGFSMIRRGSSLHWYMVGGEVFSDDEWRDQCESKEEIEIEGISPYKQAFLSEAMRENGREIGPPVALEGTSTSVKTIIAGETDLNTRKHIGRCYMKETKNTFSIQCDDPDVYNSIADRKERSEKIEYMHSTIERASPMWSLAESLFQLPIYFDHRIGLKKSILVSCGKSISPRLPKGGRGLGAQYRYVSAIEVISKDDTPIKSYNGPHYHIETEGHWRRLPFDTIGRDANGNSIKGKTWIKARNNWRQRSDSPKTIYVKSSVAMARIKIEELLKLSDAEKSVTKENEDLTSNSEEDKNVLYVLRCAAMKDEIYKIGWTSGTASSRAKDLSSASGVPESFVVVSYWKHKDPEALETSVHAILSPYRVNEFREFFQVQYDFIRYVVENEISRGENRT